MEESPAVDIVTLLAQNWPLLTIVAAIAIALILAKLLLRESGPPYEKRPSLLTQSELRFFGALQEAVDGQWFICAMVRMADLIKVRSKTPKFQAWQNRIQAKHIDFVLCDAKTMEACLAIELDDPTHQRPDRIERDAFVDEALAAAGLPILRVPTSKDYVPDELRKSISKSVGR